MGNFGKKWYNPAKNNAWSRAYNASHTAKKMFEGDGEDTTTTDDSARSDAATNQNKDRSRQGGGAQIDYYGTDTQTT